MQQVKIDFIGIGAQKAGTTWLFKQLKLLPDFSFPVLKELHYFSRSPDYASSSFLAEPRLVNRLMDEEWTKRALEKIRSKKDEPRKAEWYAKWFFSDYTDDWYLSLFDASAPFKGEISPSYALLQPKDISGMYRLAPEARIIFLLRNPVDRAWSQYRFYKGWYKKDFDFNQAKTEDIIRFMDAEGQELRSDYLSTLRNYEQVYPKDQILVGFYDAIGEQPAELMEEVVRFIGGDAGDIAKYCQLEKKYTVSPAAPMPPEVRDYLKEKYRSQIEQLALRFGGYCRQWYSELYEEAGANGKVQAQATVSSSLPVR